MKRGNPVADFIKFSAFFWISLENVNIGTATHGQEGKTDFLVLRDLYLICFRAVLLLSRNFFPILCFIKRHLNDDGIQIHLGKIAAEFNDLAVQNMAFLFLERKFQS